MVDQNTVLSFVGWFILPTAVSYIQAFYYSFTIRAGSPKPQPREARFEHDRRMIHILCIVVYLLYTIYEAGWNIQRTGDFYSALGIPVDADDRLIQSKFRRLSIRFHPDKVAPNQVEVANEMYARLTNARDVLLDPVRRFAYDRFGPDILVCKHEQCATTWEFVKFGFNQIWPTYAGGALLLFIANVFGTMTDGRYWRFLTLAVMCIFEGYVVTRPGFPAIATKFLNPWIETLGLGHPYLPFQILVLARRLSLSAFVAFNQIGPLLRQGNSAAQEQPDTDAFRHKQLERLEMLTKSLDMETMRLLLLDTSPFTEAHDEAELKGALKDWLVKNTIQNQHEVRNAIGQVVQRRRADAPAGARGAR